MVNHFINAHRFLAYLAGASFFALSGYLESRIFPRSPGAACGGWGMALLWLAFGLATTRPLLPAGPVLAFAVLVGGLAWIARYYQSHRQG
jgi:hypothetical protein